MQGFKPLPELKRRDDKHAVDNLLESAKGMLKNGETEDVVTFAQATLDEILASVLPAIRDDASAAEQVQLDAVFALFESALHALQEGNEEIHQLNQDERAISTQHKTCRDVEDTKCHEKVDCDYHLYDLWHGFIDAESDIRSLERRWNSGIKTYVLYMHVYLSASQDVCLSRFCFLIIISFQCNVSCLL